MFSIFDKLKKYNASHDASEKKGSGPVEYIIAGLGNIGPKYENTRHNAGFMAIDALASEYGAKIERMKFKATVGDCMIGEKHCLLMKPTTFMNNSGEAVAEAMRFYKVPIEKVIILFDDISLEPGRLRIRRKGSDGGHNGIKSIIFETGEENFPRIKLGVGKKPRPDYDLAAWVLSKFTDPELLQIRESEKNACAALKLMVGGEIDKAMNLYNS